MWNLVIIHMLFKNFLCNQLLLVNLLQIPFSEFNMTMTVAQRVLYLNAKLKEALKSSEQSSQNLVLKQLELKTNPTRSGKTMATIPESKAISKPSQSKEKNESKTSANTETSKKSSEPLTKLSIKDILEDPQPQIEHNPRVLTKQ